MARIHHLPIVLLVSLLPLMGCNSSKGEVPTEPEWVELFNGTSLDGWTPKVSGFALGENPGQVFRVEDGLLKVRYDQTPDFDGRFGHLFFESEFKNYNLLVEYRFVGEQAPGGPSWAWRNSGVMLHCQPPTSMQVNQLFPVCLEMQTLGSTPAQERSTANLCTPGTHVTLNGNLHTQHCTDSTSAPVLEDDWVTIEIEVRGSQSIRHIVAGQTVLEYSNPVLDPSDPDAAALINAGHPNELDSGFISLQSESHPVDYRRIEIQVLDV